MVARPPNSERQFVIQLGQIYPFLILPLLTGIIASAAAAWRVPGTRVRGLLQLGAAGLMFGAVGGIVLPQLVRDRALLPLIVGFGAGSALVLGVRSVVQRLQRSAEEDPLPITEIVTAALGYWASGLFIGVGFALGPASGGLLALSATGLILVLSVSTVALLRQKEVSRGLAFALVCALALLIGAGLVMGVGVSNLLTGSALNAVLAFAAAALLCVVAEGMLAEAASVRLTPMATAVFSLGFLALFVLEIVLRPAA